MGKILRILWQTSKQRQSVEKDSQLWTRLKSPIINAEKDSRLRRKVLFWKFVNKVSRAFYVDVHVCVCMCETPYMSHRARANDYRYMCMYKVFETLEEESERWNDRCVSFVHSISIIVPVSQSLSPFVIPRRNDTELKTRVKKILSSIARNFFSLIILEYLASTIAIYFSLLTLSVLSFSYNLIYYTNISYKYLLINLFCVFI